MVSDAESHADEDRRQRELAEARNNGENAAYQAERQLKELGDAVDSSSKDEIEAGIKAVRESLTSNDAAEIKSKVEALQTELDQITDEINRKEGQLNLWKELTDLTTVTVTLREKQPFVPLKGPALAEVPTFDMRASKTFTDSWEVLVKIGQGVGLCAIALTPWLPVLLVVGVGIWGITWLMRLRRAMPEPVTSSQTRLD